MVRKLFMLIGLLLIGISVKADAPEINVARSQQKAKAALLFNKQKGYNTKYCILIDMSLPSGVKRFMVWDFKQNKAILTGLVSHGCGNSPWSGMWSKDKPTFSNADGSHCTSLGKYAITARGYSNWGIKVRYCMAGLEKTNSNAMARQIVFHSWEQVPDEEIYPNGTPEGWGCPAISNSNMKIVDALLRKQKKRMMMWIYN
jgi:hypothetical protein